MKKGDRVSKLALRVGYRSRTAIKLLQINEKFGFVKGDVLDLGSAPGGTLQVMRQLTEHQVVGVDVREIEPIEGVKLISEDIANLELEEKFDTIFSDVGPLSDDGKVDMKKAFQLELQVLNVMKMCLKNGGNFVMKIFEAEEVKDIIDELRQLFKQVSLFKPEASRKGNKELYVVCLGKTLPG